jgi:hypothetical protein
LSKYGNSCNSLTVIAKKSKGGPHTLGHDFRRRSHASRKNPGETDPQQWEWKTWVSDQGEITIGCNFSPYLCSDQNNFGIIRQRRSFGKCKLSFTSSPTAPQFRRSTDQSTEAAVVSPGLQWNRASAYPRVSRLAVRVGRPQPGRTPAHDVLADLLWGPSHRGPK